MTDLQQQYSDTPQRKSPESLDAKILAHAEHKAQLYRRDNSAGRRQAWLPGWPPLAASAAVACLCLFLVMRPNFDPQIPYTPATTSTDTEETTPPALDSTDDALAKTTSPPTALNSAGAVTDTVSTASIEVSEPGVNSTAAARNLTGIQAEAQITARPAQTGAQVLQAEPSVLAESIRALTETESIEMQINSAASDQTNAPAPGAIAIDRSAKRTAGITYSTDSDMSSNTTTASALLPGAEKTPTEPEVTANRQRRELIDPNSATVAAVPVPVLVADVADDSLITDRRRQSLASDTGQWLRTLPGYQYVLQLSIGRNLNSMEDELRLAGFDLQEIHIYPLMLRNDPGYAALYGPFGSDTEAYNRAREIKQQGRLDPWVREIADVLDER